MISSIDVIIMTTQFEETILRPEFRPIYQGFKQWSLQAKGLDPETLTPPDFADLAIEYRDKVNDAMHEWKEHGKRSYRSYYFSKVETKRVSEMSVVPPGFKDTLTANELYFYEQFRKWSKDVMRVDPEGSGVRQFNALVRAYAKWLKKAVRSITWARVDHERNVQRMQKAAKARAPGEHQPVREIRNPEMRAKYAKLVPVKTRRDVAIRELKALAREDKIGTAEVTKLNVKTNGMWSAIMADLELDYRASIGTKLAAFSAAVESLEARVKRLT